MHLLSIISLAFLLAQGALATLITVEYPHLLITLKQDEPDTAFNTQYTGEIALSEGSHEIWTELSFDVPSNHARRCLLSFTLATGGPWKLSGSDSGPKLFDIYTLEPAIDRFTDTWNKHPRLLGQVATVEVGNGGVVSMNGGEVECMKGQVQQFMLVPGSARDFGLEWFELNNPKHGILYEMHD